jgi:N-acetylglucosamine repressor
LCECGRRGCFQSYIADWALLYEASKVSHMDKLEKLFAAALTEL